MDPNFFVVANSRWLLQAATHPKRLGQGFCPLGRAIAHLSVDCSVQVKFRADDGRIIIDDQAKVAMIGDEYFIKSEPLAAFVRGIASAEWLAFFLEGAPSEARCVVQPWDAGFLDAVSGADPTIRLGSYDLPPGQAVVVDSERPLRALYRAAVARDPELYAVYASSFLEAPHILTALFTHVFTIQAEDNIRFPVVVKKLAEQLRTLLDNSSKSVSIRVVRKSHVDLWAEVQGERFGFLDGGVARIPAMAGMEPLGLRVGVYSVLPGVTDPGKREQWRMAPFVIGDLIDRGRPTQERPETRRLHEAARYTLEPLTALQHLKEFSDTRALLMHGPLVNQFVQYDERDPNYIPFVAPAFLTSVGIVERDVLSLLSNIPDDAAGRSMWNHFMAIYGVVLNRVNDCPTPIAGVVERPTGRAVTLSVLERLREDSLVNADYVTRVRNELERYDITDDFLFGCILRSGEYITPVSIQKNRPHRARDNWQPVVRQYPMPSAMLLKTEDMNFPFRVEMNKAASAQVDFLARFLFHTARLLPRYAFPVGLDIVDKYAKIPDWISRGISTQLSAAVLRRALRTGDANLVTQIRLMLTKGPRDFFFRPSSRM